MKIEDMHPNTIAILDEFIKKGRGKIGFWVEDNTGAEWKVLRLDMVDKDGYAPDQRIRPNVDQQRKTQECLDNGKRYSEI